MGDARKTHGECASLAWNTCDLYIAAMCPGNGQGQVEAQPCARQGTASISPEKPVKNMRQVAI